jgi:hypothetical protein
MAVLHWIEKTYGKKAASSLMRTLRIPCSMLNNPDEPVRLRLLARLLHAARARGIGDSSIFEMGLGALTISENTPISRALAHIKKPEEAYECFFTELIPKFESNYDYKIEKSNSDSIILRIQPREQRIEENGLAVVSDSSVSLYRWGVAAGTLKAIGYPSATATPIQRIDSDRPYEIIKLEWPSTAQAAILLSSRRRSLPPAPNAP